jgi:hypothetical protein
MSEEEMIAEAIRLSEQESKATMSAAERQAAEEEEHLRMAIAASQKLEDQRVQDKKLQRKLTMEQKKHELQAE